jgi:Phosphotransferase enzyme family
VPIVLEHGDLAPPNLLRLRDGQLGVVDWEVADLDGLALGDLLFFAAFVGSATAADAGDRSAAGPARPTIPGVARPAVERQAAVLGLDPGLIAVLDVVMWARWADRQLARFADPDDATPIGERLPRRHIRSWSAAVAHLEERVREADGGHPRYDARPQPPDR